MKKFVSIIVCFAMLISLVSASAVDIPQPELVETEIVTMEDILTNYAIEKNKLQNNISTNNTARSNTDLLEYNEKLAEIKTERNNALLAAGYEVYSVTSDNYYEIERMLQTNFSEIGLSPDQSFLIVVGDMLKSEMANSGRSTVSSEFSWTYNGNTYRMRTLTVSPEDDYSYLHDSNEASVVNTSVPEIIEHLLNCAVSIYMGALKSYVGILWDLLGLELVDITGGTSDLEFAALADWTRKYAQVWSAYDQAWTYGSCVEYVVNQSWLQGNYWSSEKNRSVVIGTYEHPIETITTTKRSSKYDNATWKYNTAANNMYYSLPCTYDITGDQDFYMTPVDPATGNEITGEEDIYIFSIDEPITAIPIL